MMCAVLYVCRMTIIIAIICMNGLCFSYRMAQNFDGENIDEFDEFPAIRQYFSYQNFPFS